MDFPKQLDEFGKDWVFENLEIIFTIGTPMLLTHPFIALDSLLLHLYAKEFYQKNFNLLPSNKILRDDLFPPQLKIPIKKDVATGLYHCSFSIFDEKITLLPRFHHIRRRFEDRYLHLMKKVKKIGINKGTLKNYDMKIVQISPKTVRFYCVGVKTIIDHLLSKLEGLGKKVNTGNGTILNYEIHSCKKDHSWVKDGISQRPIPVRYLMSTSRQVPMTWVPPYWARDMIEVCAPPNANITFQPGVLCT